MEIVFLSGAALALYTLWLCSKIVGKTGLSRWWTLCLLIPYVNVIMLWIFAFAEWPSIKKHPNNS